MRYRKVPVVIEAVQLTTERQEHLRAVLQRVAQTGADDPPVPMPDWCPVWLWIALGLPQGTEGAVYFVRVRPPAPLVVRMREGSLAVAADSWLIQGVAGELYPCDPAIFAATYEPA